MGAAWGIEKVDGVHQLLQWELTFRPWNVVVARCSTQRQCIAAIPQGSWVEEGPSPWPAHVESPVAWAVRWKGSHMERAEFEDLVDAHEWAREDVAA